MYVWVSKSEVEVEFCSVKEEQTAHDHFYSSSKAHRLRILCSSSRFDPFCVSLLSSALYRYRWFVKKVCMQSVVCLWEQAGQAVSTSELCVRMRLLHSVRVEV